MKIASRNKGLEINMLKSNLTKTSKINLDKYIKSANFGPKPGRKRRRDRGVTALYNLGPPGPSGSNCCLADVL